MDPQTHQRESDDPDADPVNGKHPATDAFQDAGKHFAELKEYVSYYIDARLDAIKATCRRIGIFAVLGIVACIAAAAVVVMGVVFVLMGIAQAISAATGMVWLGHLLTGVLVLGGIGLGIYLGLKKFTAASMSSMVRKYEQRQTNRRANFGRSVRDSAGKLDPVTLPKAATEAQFLEREAANAKAAIGETVNGIAHSLGTAADPRAWTREHPIIALGAATIAGFFAAKVLTPAKDETFKERWDELVEQVAALRESEPEAEEPSRNPTPKKKSHWMHLLEPIIDLAKAALASKVSGFVADRMNQSNGHPDGDPEGYPTSPDDSGPS